MSDSENDHERSEESFLPSNFSSWEDTLSSDEESFSELDDESVLVLEVALVRN